MDPLDKASSRLTDAVTIRLFGRDYVVRGLGDQEYAQRLADYISEKTDDIRRKTHVVSTQDLVALTLLNVTDEYFRYKLVKEQALKDLEEKAQRLLQVLDNSI